MSFNQNKNTKLFPRTLLEHDNSFLNEKKVFIGMQMTYTNYYQNTFSLQKINNKTKTGLAVPEAVKITMCI